MAQYIKKEMPDMSGAGQQKAYYKLKPGENWTSMSSLNAVIPSTGDTEKVWLKALWRLFANILPMRLPTDTA